MKFSYQKKSHPFLQGPSPPPNCRSTAKVLIKSFFSIFTRPFFQLTIWTFFSSFFLLQWLSLSQWFIFSLSRTLSALFFSLFFVSEFFRSLKRLRKKTLSQISSTLAPFSYYSLRVKWPAASHNRFYDYFSHFFLSESSEIWALC